MCDDSSELMQQFISVLQVTEGEAVALIEDGYRNLEEIVYVPWDEYLETPGFEEEKLREMRRLAHEYLLYGEVMEPFELEPIEVTPRALAYLKSEAQRRGLSDPVLYVRFVDKTGRLIQPATKEQDAVWERVPALGWVFELEDFAVQLPRIAAITLEFVSGIATYEEFLSRYENDLNFMKNGIGFSVEPWSRSEGTIDLVDEKLAFI